MVKLTKSTEIQWLNLLQNWLISSIFAVTICYFLIRLLGDASPRILRYVLPCFLICGLLGLSLQYWKIAVPVIGGIILLGAFQVLTGLDIRIPGINLSVWSRLSTQLSEALKWALTFNADKGVMPAQIPMLLAVSTSVVSTLTNWLLPIPLLNMFLLIGPMLYIDDLTADARWFIFLFIGLFCVYCSYAYRQDSTDREQRAPILFGAVLIVATFAVQSILSPTTFYHEGLSRTLNALNPVEGGEISSFSLNEVGFYPQGNLRVGGPVHPSPDTYLTISTTGKAFYLRGSTYDAFDGNVWSLSKPQSLKRYSWGGDYYNAFSNPMAENFWFTSERARSIALEGGLYRPTTYILRSAEPTRIIFHGGKPVWLSHSDKVMESYKTAEAALNQQSQGSFLYSESGMLVSKSTYEDKGITVLDSVVPVENLWNAPDLEVEPYSTLHPLKGEGKHQYEYVVNKYDAELAGILYQSKMTFTEMIRAMRKHFDTHYTYELNVAEVPEDQHFIEHFLRTKKGYCVYFATLWTELLKDAGYETRYAEGFVVPAAGVEGDNLAIRDLTGEKAHAWVEIKTDGFGWYPIEATPTSHIAALSNIDPTQTKKPDEPEISSSSSEQQSPSEEESSEHASQASSSENAPTPPGESNRDMPSGIPGMIGIGVISIIVIFITVKGIQFRQRLKHPHFAKRGAKDDMRIIWRHVKRLYGLLGIRIRSADTISMILDRAPILLDDDAKSALSDDLERLYYGDLEPSEDAIKRIHGFYAALEAQTRAKLNPFRWLLSDVLLVTHRMK